MSYRKQHDGDRVMPEMTGYKMECCDCGLVHRIDFEVRLVIAEKPNNIFTTVKPRNANKLRVILTPYRDNRATAAKRRKKKLTAALHPKEPT
jgi:hypothetical protein